MLPSSSRRQFGSRRSSSSTTTKEIRWVIQALLFFCFIVVGLLWGFGVQTFGYNKPLDDGTYRTTRQVSMNGGETTCSPTKFETYGGVALEAFCVLYLFIGIAIVADDYFIVSLEVISDKLNMSPDVAGATLMAMGSSAPELFTNVASVLDSKPEIANDVGVGAIVGSALFNLLIIVGLSVLVSPKSMKLLPFPMARDSFVYLISIGVLVYVIWDQVVTLLDSLIMVAVYVIYVLHLGTNRYLVRWMCPGCIHHFENIEEDDDDDDDEDDDQRLAQRDHTNELMDVTRPRLNSELYDPHSLSSIPPTSSKPSTTPAAPSISIVVSESNTDTNQTTAQYSAKDFELSNSPSGLSPSTSKRRERNPSFEIANATRSIIRHEDTTDDYNDEENDNGDSHSFDQHQQLFNDNDSDDDNTNVDDTNQPLVSQRSPSSPTSKTTSSSSSSSASSSSSNSKVSMCLQTIKKFITISYRILAKPFEFVYRFTIPDCSPESSWAKWYVVTFIMSLVWISILTFIMVEFINRIGCVLGISQALMGLTVVAAGTSIPDCLGSMLVARKGEGDMAVSNAVGSNIFDILVCLGVPWLVSALFLHDVSMGSSEIVVSTFILLAGLLLYVYLVVAQCFLLRRWSGVVMVLAYCLYLSYAIAAEFLDWNR